MMLIYNLSKFASSIYVVVSKLLKTVLDRRKQNDITKHYVIDRSQVSASGKDTPLRRDTQLAGLANEQTHGANGSVKIRLCKSAGSPDREGT